nr:MAG TPA: hypothetical protein [Caudoviricetes sp.]
MSLFRVGVRIALARERQDSESAEKECDRAKGSSLSDGDTLLSEIADAVHERGLLGGLFDFGRLGHEGSFLEGLVLIIGGVFFAAVIQKAYNPCLGYRFEVNG